MEENKKEMTVKSSGSKKVWIVIGALVGAVVVLYLALCIYAGVSGTIFPNVVIGGVNVGGMTAGQAEQALSAAVQEKEGAVSLEMTCGTWKGILEEGCLQTDCAQAAQQALEYGRDNFFTQGGMLAANFLGRGARLEIQAGLSEEGTQQMELLLDEAEQKLPDAAVEPSWSVDEDQLVFTVGVSGRQMDRDQAVRQVNQTLSQGLNELMEGSGDGKMSLELPAEETQPGTLDFQEIYDEIHTEPKNAEFDPETREIMPHVTGVSFDVAAVQARADAAAEGQTIRVPLTLTEPETTEQQLNEVMFSDVLGECTTTVGGTAARLGNVTLAAEKCNEYILMPGEVFSYNDVVGPRTTAAGFLPAPAYVQGQTVNEVGGGICQVSSTIYLATLRSNLEIVERRNHSYISDYITAGMDATVAYNAIDYKFKNDTEYPIMIEASVKNRKLTVQIVGTKTDDTRVEMTYSIVSTTPYEVIYQADESVPVGTTKVSVTPYKGYKVVVYRNVYDGDGKLISSEQENVSTYRKRDKVILYNPADAGSLGIPTGGSGSTPETSPSPSASVSPGTSPTPGVSPTPSPSPAPSASPSPVPSASPSPSPSASPSPEASPSPSGSAVPSASPAPTQSPVLDPNPMPSTP